MTNYINDMLYKFPGELGQIQKDAYEQGVPIIPRETAVFLRFLLSAHKPKTILEIGTAVGFSAALFCACTEARVTTIDRYDIMLEQAVINIDRLGLNDRITIIKGEALATLKTLTEPFDFIFIDAAKGQYINFLPHCIRLLNPGGILAADDVLQNGTLAGPRLGVPRRQRTTHTRMRQFLDAVNNCEELVTSVIPLGDGLVVCYKN